MLAALRGPKTMSELCREHEIADSLLRKWREQFLAAGAERLQAKAGRTEVDELRRQISRLERALGRKTMEVESADDWARRTGSCSEVARRNPTDGMRMVAALASRELAGAAVNRKRVQRSMREHPLLQHKRSECGSMRRRVPASSVQISPSSSNA